MARRFGAVPLRSHPNSSPEYLVDRSKRSRPPTHPGVLFGEDVLPELRKTNTLAEIAEFLGVSRQTLYRLAAGAIAISPEMAVRLGKLCGNGPGLWIRMQGRYDTWEASRRLARELKKIPTLA
jgi:addiction module HigA family antidote